MARKKGTVTKAGKSKFSYYLQLDGDPFYYNTKFQPKCGEGDVVGIEFNKQNDQRGQITSIKVLEDNSGGYESSNSERSGGYGGGSKPSGGGSSSNDDRQNSIMWQSCQKVAAELTHAAVAAGAIASKGNPDSKAAEIRGYFDETVVGLFKDARDPLNSPTYKAVSKIDADAGEASDDWDDSSKGDADWDDDDEWS